VLRAYTKPRRICDVCMETFRSTKNTADTIVKSDESGDRLSLALRVPDPDSRVEQIADVHKTAKDEVAAKGQDASCDQETNQPAMFDGALRPAGLEVSPLALEEHRHEETTGVEEQTREETDAVADGTCLEAYDAVMARVFFPIVIGCWLGAVCIRVAMGFLTP